MQNQVLVLVAALLLPLYLVWGRLELTDTFRLMPRRGSQFGSSIDVAVTAIRLRYIDVKAVLLGVDGAADDDDALAVAA